MDTEFLHHVDICQECNQTRFMNPCERICHICLEEKASEPKPIYIWNPWIIYEKELDPLPIEEPPCKNCKHFRPMRRYFETKFEGVRLCHANKMHSDFRCFENR